jgi:hypothetical protein
MAINWGDKPTTSSATSMGMYPEWMKKDMLAAQDAYKKLYEHNLGAGYRPYTGMTTAGFTPEQIASQQGLASMVGSQAPLQQEALGLTRGLTSEFTPEQAQKYMSPYLRASLDAQKAAAQRQFEGTKLPQFEAQAVQAGGMSGLGSRAGVQAAELQSGQNRLMADLEATGQQKAYQDAQNLFKSQKEREKQSALALQNLNKEIFSGGLKEQALLEAIGSEKQQMVQSMLDEAQTKYWDKEEFGRNELNKWYQSLLGNPIWKQPNVVKTGTQAGGGPGIGKTAMSLAATGLGAYFGGGGTFGGMLKAGGGSIRGGLASMPQARPYMNHMRRNMGGQVVPPVVYRQEPGQVGGDDRSAIMKLLFPGPSMAERGTMPKPRINAPQIPLPEQKRRRAEELKIERGKPSLKTLLKGGANQAGQPIEAVPLSNPEPIPPGADQYRRAALGGVSEEDLKQGFTQEASAMRQAERAKQEALLVTATSVKSPDGIDTLRNAYDKYKTDVQGFVEADPYRAQKFWFTVAAAISKPGGNAFTNMAQGFKEAVDGLDASAEEKKKFRIALAGKALATETAVAGIEEKRKTSKAERVQALNIALASATGKTRTELLKLHGNLLKGKMTSFVGLEDNQLKYILLGFAEGIPNKAAKKLVINKINNNTDEAIGLYRGLLGTINAEAKVLQLLRKQ